MIYYFTLHTLLGLFAMASIAAYGQARNIAMFDPKLLQALNLLAWLGYYAPIAAVITTLVNYGVLWSLATAGELFLGAVLAMLLSDSLKFLAAYLSPVAIITLMGALWKFWHL